MTRLASARALPPRVAPARPAPPGSRCGGGSGFPAGVWAAKRRAYRAACLLVASAGGLAASGSLIHHGVATALLVHLPLAGLGLWGCVRLAEVGAVERVEPMGVGALTTYLLLGDVIDLATHRPGGPFVAASSSAVQLLTWVLCCLSMTPRLAVRWMLGLWGADAALAWLGLSRLPWTAVHSAEISRELVGLSTVVLLILLNRYHSMARVSLATNRDLRALALTDELTALPNRRAMCDHLARRDGDLTVVMVDLDHFKRVNDTSGHDRGDEVLRRIAAVLREESATEGVAGRWGGEEFVVVMDGARLGRANLLAERLRAKVAARDDLCGVTLSIGVTAQRPREDAGGVLARADELMYAAKRGGRNQVRVLS